MAFKADGGINMQPQQMGHELLRLYYAAKMSKMEYFRRCEERTKLCAALRRLKLTPEEKRRNTRTPDMLSAYRSASAAEQSSDIAMARFEHGNAIETATTVLNSVPNHNVVQRAFAITSFNRDKNNADRICAGEMMRLTPTHADRMKSLSIQDGLSGSEDSITEGNRDRQFRIECLENDAKVQEVERKLKVFQEDAEWAHLLGELMNQGIRANSVANLAIVLEDEKAIQDFYDRLLAKQGPLDLNLNNKRRVNDHQVQVDDDEVSDDQVPLDYRLFPGPLHLKIVVEGVVFELCSQNPFNAASMIYISLAPPKKHQTHRKDWVEVCYHRFAELYILDRPGRVKEVQGKKFFMREMGPFANFWTSQTPNQNGWLWEFVLKEAPSIGEKTSSAAASGLVAGANIGRDNQLRPDVQTGQSTESASSSVARGTISAGGLGKAVNNTRKASPGRGFPSSKSMTAGTADINQHESRAANSCSVSGSETGTENQGQADIPAGQTAEPATQNVIAAAELKKNSTTQGNADRGLVQSSASMTARTVEILAYLDLDTSHQNSTGGDDGRITSRSGRMLNTTTPEPGSVSFGIQSKRRAAVLDTNLDGALPHLHKKMKIHLPDAHIAREKKDVLQVPDSSLGRVPAVKDVAAMASTLPTKAPGTIPETWSAGMGIKFGKSNGMMSRSDDE